MEVYVNAIMEILYEIYESEFPFKYCDAFTGEDRL